MKTKMAKMYSDERKCLIKEKEAMLTEIEEGMDSDGRRHLVKQMEGMLEEVKQPELESNCCIYKVPRKMRERNPGAYTPQVVSIGPLHHGHQKLKPMEELKLRYLKSYLGRSNLKLEDCIGALKEKEKSIRSCYAETISRSSDDFVKMILVDACFIIEYFFRFIERYVWDKDPILSRPYRANDMMLDLILFENQLPFFVLEDLFTPTCGDGKLSSFLEVSFHYLRLSYMSYSTVSRFQKMEFNCFCQNYLKKIGDTGECEEVKVQHLTDFVRIFFLPSHQLRKETEFTSLKYCASQLMEAGLELRVDQNKSFTELQYENGVITMPQLLVEYGTESLLRNMAALEQCHYPRETYVAEYIVLLDFLINSCKDVDILVDSGLMVNCLGDGDKVVAIFNDIGMGMMLPTSSVHYIDYCKGLNEYYQKPLHRYKAIFKHDYLSTPWKIVSSIAAIVLLLLTLIQAITSIMQVS